MTFLADSQIAQRYAVHRCTVWRWTREGKGFPKPIKIMGSTRWRLTEIEAWEMQTVEGISQSANPQ